ncbi:AlpA family transcriptional regulator [Naasia sp. SYSU D00948]|uniref:helix-turn-helix transcriptional regulator n=1 Tax=Naasia sp. SYSU D00948 TaxID=2817379 RepID=UPI001B3047DB|nr:helix-turn-helix domain-containing protein [Naasia sp. SYSU D00948]
MSWPFIGHLFAQTAVAAALRSMGIGRVGPILGRLAHLVGMRDDTITTGLEKMLSTRELAEYLGVAPQAIYDLRCDGRGPRAVHVGRELRYRVSEIEAWIERMSEPERGAEGTRHVG